MDLHGSTYRAFIRTGFKLKPHATLTGLLSWQSACDKDFKRTSLEILLTCSDIELACHISRRGNRIIHSGLMSCELRLQIYTLTFTSQYTSATAIVNMCNSQPWMPTHSLRITNQWACISLKPFSSRGFSCDGRMNRRKTGTPQAGGTGLSKSESAGHRLKLLHTHARSQGGLIKLEHNKLCDSLCVCGSVLWLASGSFKKNEYSLFFIFILFYFF